MALSLIDVGTTANDGTGDPLRTAFQTVNTAITAVNNAVVVGTGTTTFKDDSGTYGVAVASNGDVTFTNAGATTGMTWDASANSNAGGLGIGTTTPAYELEVYAATGNADIQVKSSAGNHAYLRLVANGGSNALQLYALSGGASYLLNDTNGGTAYFSGRDTGNNVRTYLSGNEGVTSLFGNGTLAAKVSIGGDFTWQNAGATAGMTWDASALTNAGAVGVGTTTPTEQLDLSGDAIRIRTAQTPASAAATGDAGIICWDASYIYVCTATNTWKRVAISTW